MSKTLFLDELRPYALRNVAHLSPGTELMRVHIPDLAKNQKNWIAYCVKLVVKDLVAVKSYSGNLTLVVRYDGIHENGKSFANEFYLTDGGIIPRADGLYSDVNFTVIPAQLKAKGIEIIEDASDAYKERVARRMVASFTPGHVEIVKDLPYFQSGRGWL